MRLFPVVSRSMYFHVHIISILVVVALNPKNKSRKASSSSSLTSMLQCQPVHSNNNDKIASPPPLPPTHTFLVSGSQFIECPSLPPSLPGTPISSSSQQGSRGHSLSDDSSGGIRASRVGQQLIKHTHTHAHTYVN